MQQFKLLKFYFWTADDQTNPNGASGSTCRKKKPNCVKAPKIYWKYTRNAVLTMEWIDGIKLTNESGLRQASLIRKELIDQVLYENSTSILCSATICKVLLAVNDQNSKFIVEFASARIISLTQRWTALSSKNTTKEIKEQRQ